MPKTVDYSKWDNLDLSDDDESEPAPNVQQKAAALMEQQRQEAEERQRQEAERDSLNAAIQAAAMASSVGNTDIVGQMMAQAQAAAPLNPEMESILSTLPPSAQIAARASAHASAAANSHATGAPAGAKEPSLAELLKAQNISIENDADPELEDVREFFETPEEAAVAEKKLAEAEARAAAAAAAMSAATISPTRSSAKTLDPGAIEWEGDWK